jgi:hypothetical protein
MSQTEAKYKEVIKSITYGAYTEENLFIQMHSVIPVCRHNFFNVDSNKTLENLKNVIKDYYILEGNEYRKKENAICLQFRTICFYTIECPIVIRFDEAFNPEDGTSTCTITFLGTGEYLSIFNCIAYKEKTAVIRSFEYILNDRGDFVSQSLNAVDMHIDLSKNYNDDLPNEEIMDFINSDKPGLAILYGAPGCGKTSYIRHLIYNSDKKFIYLDQSLFAYICDASFVSFLMEHKDHIFILEDCETLLADRVATGNTRLATLLNISDGLLGDSLNIKFICTFNCPLSRLDGAIKRKGRLKVQYEFKPLCREKALALAESIGSNLDASSTYSLAEIYNPEDNGATEDIKRKVGF